MCMCLAAFSLLAKFLCQNVNFLKKSENEVFMECFNFNNLKFSRFFLLGFSKNSQKYNIEGNLQISFIRQVP